MVQIYERLKVNAKMRETFLIFKVPVTLQPNVQLSSRIGRNANSA